MCTWEKSNKIAIFCWLLLTFGGKNGLFHAILWCFQKNTEKKFWKHAKEIKKHADVFLLINMYFWDDGEGIGCKCLKKGWKWWFLYFFRI